MGAPDFSGFVAIYNAAGFPFFFTCSACDWYNALYQPFHTPGQRGFFLEEEEYCSEGWSSALNCVNACLHKHHLSWVQGSCNSINGLCWWQKPQQESSSVTGALTWKYNCNSCRFSESSFNINVEHAWYYWNAFEALKTKSICRLRLESQRKQLDLLLWPLDCCSQLDFIQLLLNAITCIWLKRVFQKNWSFDRKTVRGGESAVY